MTQNDIHPRTSLPADQLLLEVFRCEAPQQIFNEAFSKGLTHPCRKVVDAQFSDKKAAILHTDEWHRPEPWSGPLAIAPLLFVSSNPSYSHDEVYPTLTASGTEVVHFFNNRFRDRAFTDINGFPALISRATAGDTRYARNSKFWPAIQRLAKDLLGDTRGQLSAGNVCMTEIVHCKSKSEVGVEEAEHYCHGRYMSRILENSPARVVVVLGKHAKEFVCAMLGVPPPDAAYVYQTKDRTYAFSAHPNGWRQEGGLRSQWNGREEEFNSLILALREDA